MTTILSHLNLILTVAVAAISLAVLWRYLGLRGLASGLVALAALFLYRRGRTDGRTETLAKERADVGRAERQAETERVRSDLRNADPGQLRESDGFRRD